MQQTSNRRVRARMRGRLIEPLEEIDIPDGQEFTMDLNVPVVQGTSPIAIALNESAGAWSEAAHPELMTRQDVVCALASVRSDFDRGYGR
jgi:hypothetical protein